MVQMSCKFICSKCGKTKDFPPLTKKNYICITCKALSKKIYNMKYREGLDLIRCQSGFCLYEDIATNKALLRIRDDGKIVCVGCHRKKRRMNRKLNHRFLWQQSLEGMSCFYCSRFFYSKYNNMDYFDIIKNNLIFNYSKFIRMKVEHAKLLLHDKDIKITCIQCTKDEMTNILR